MTLIVLEGPDFAGKSTIADALHKRLASLGLTTSARRTCLHSGFLERLAARAYASETVPNAIKSLCFHAAYLGDGIFWRDSADIVTVQESCYLRVKAHDVILRRSFGLLSFRVLEWSVPKSPFSFFLNCPIEERLRRWRAAPHADRRDERRFGDGLERTLDLDRTLERLCLEAGFHGIDTGGLSIDQSAETILETVTIAGGIHGI